MTSSLDNAHMVLLLLVLHGHSGMVRRVTRMMRRLHVLQMLLLRRVVVLLELHSILDRQIMKDLKVQFLYLESFTL